MKYFLPFVISGLILTSCCKPAEPLLDLQIEDVDGNNLLINAVPSDTTWALLQNATDTSGTALPITGGLDAPVLLLGMWEITSGYDYFLMVNPQDVDTFNIVFDVKGRCNLKIKVERFLYNGNDFVSEKDGGIKAKKY